MAGSLAADAICVRIGTAIFPATVGYVHFRFSDYAKLTVVGVVIACLSWPIVTRISSAPRWLFFRLAVLVTLLLWLPDLYILDLGQPGRAVAVLIVMHLAIAVVTYCSLVHIARVRPAPGRPVTLECRTPVRIATRDAEGEVSRVKSAPVRSRTLAEMVLPEPVAAKVPEITWLFWVIKILTTCGGEAVSDYLAQGNRLAGGAAEALLMVIALTWQFRTRRYTAAAYWFLAYVIAIFGTGVSDALHLFAGIPYAGTTLGWAIVLALIFWRWDRSEGTLSIHSVVTRRREMYYWAVVFATFALGTALGDFTATVLGLGYLASGIMFGLIILIPAVAWSRYGLGAVAAFWFAYVVTRPLGASFADYFGRPHSLSGVDFGSGKTAVIVAIAVAVLVGYLSVTRRDIQPPAPDPAEPQATPQMTPRQPAAQRLLTVVWVSIRHGQD